MSDPRLRPGELGLSSIAGPRGSGYVVTLYWSIVSGRLEVARFELEAKKGVTTTMLRSIALAELAEKHRPQMVKLHAKHLERPELTADDRARVQAVLNAERGPLQNPDLLELVATTYRRHGGRAPAKAAHKALIDKGYDLSPEYVRQMVRRCRELGMLGKAIPGRAGER